MERKPGIERTVRVDASKLPSTVKIIVEAQVPSTEKVVSSKVPSTEKVVTEEPRTVTQVEKGPTSAEKGAGKIAVDKEPTNTKKVVKNKESSTVTHVDKGPSARKVILTTIEIAALALLGYLGYQAWENQNDVNAAVLDKLATLNAPGLVTPGVLPTSTLTLAPTESPTVTTTATTVPTPEATSTPEATARPDRMTEWTKFWPDTAKDAATMFGGSASDWQKNPDWPGDKLDPNANQFGVNGYKPTEWRPTNPENPPYYWPKTAAEAAEYFFPGQNIDLRFLEQNKYGGWHLLEDHWKFDGNADKYVSLCRGCVAAGYTTNGDQDNIEIQRAWVAFGGTGEGIILSAKGQGMTIWMPGTDPNKVALEWQRYNNTHYTGPNGEELGPDPVNFLPIYNAPGYDILSQIFDTGYGAVVSQTLVESPREILKKSLPLAGGTSPQTVRRPQDKGRSAMFYDMHPLKGNRNIRA